MTDVKALRALLDKATPGEWEASGTMVEVSVDDGGIGMFRPVAQCHVDAEEVEFANAELIVAAVTALPDLLALAEAVRELAPVLRQLDATLPVYPTATVQAPARRVLAILEGA